MNCIKVITTLKLYIIIIDLVNKDEDEEDSPMVNNSNSIMTDSNGFMKQLRHA